MTMDNVSTSGPASLAGKRVLVMGLGRFGGGVGVSRWLAGQGAVVTVNDATSAGELSESIRALDGLPITFKLGGHDVADFIASELIVVNPAVDRAKSEVLQAAAARGVPMTTEMNLFLERCRGIGARTVGITGSVGKSTTTALIYEALSAGLRGAGPDGARVFLGGNIGRSLLLELEQLRRQDVVVLELSSFMLEETAAIKWSPAIAVVTNVFENHLDRHGTLALYTKAKQNILRYQHADDLAILNADHDLVSRWVHLARGKVVKYTTRGPATGRPVLAMPGEHNQSNAAAAVAVLEAVAARVPGVDKAAAVAAMEAFPGLSHRLQLVHTATVGDAGRKVRCYNDSKATSPNASITAIEAFKARTAIFLVGGYDKHVDFSPFEALLAEKAGGVIGIGATGGAIVARVKALGGVSRVEEAGTLETAVPLAMRWAAEEVGLEAVVLSPASASYDQFPNYEVRGERFAALCAGF